MFRNKKYKISSKLGIRIYKLRDGWTYFWLFAGLAALSYSFYLFLEFYMYHFGKHLWNNYKTPPERFIRIIEESFIGTFLVVIICLLLLDIMMETSKLIHWSLRHLKSIQLNKQFF